MQGPPRGHRDWCLMVMVDKEGRSVQRGTVRVQNHDVILTWGVERETRIASC